MQQRISIIYANRNRDVERIKASLDSLPGQWSGDFEVVFVDYGSNHSMVEDYKKLLSFYSFTRFLSLKVSHLLWNKSKALNYGIKNAAFPYVFIADVDIIFHPDTLSLFKKLVSPEKFFLFPLSYLDRNESKRLYTNYLFQELKPSRIGEVNGMLLASREALLQINGLDEFFHFYGAEDEDLFARLENSGFQRERINKFYLYHNWHQSFSGSEDKLLTVNPRVKNIMRINERHFLRNRERGITKPLFQKGMAESVGGKSLDVLEVPLKSFRIANVLSHIEHFLWEELSSYKGETVKVEFFEDPYFRSLKYKIKKRFGKQSQPYISMKELNDLLLKEILFKYRDHNYSFKIGKDSKIITFCIQL